MHSLYRFLIVILLDDLVYLQLKLFIEIYFVLVFSIEHLLFDLYKHIVATLFDLILEFLILLF
jgi:hypothetical protein